MNHCMGEHEIAIEGYYFETDRLKDVYIFSIATMQQVDTLKNLKALSQDDFKALCRRWVLNVILNDKKAV